MQCLTDSRCEPRPSERAATYHDRIGLRLTERFACGFRIDDVAVDDDRQASGLLYFSDRPPIGRALIELLARSSMYGDRLHAQALCAHRELGRIPALVVPAQPHLE